MIMNCNLIYLGAMNALAAQEQSSLHVSCHNGEGVIKN